MTTCEVSGVRPANLSAMRSRIEEIQLPPGAQIGAIVRGEEVLMAHHDTKIEADDHVILFIADRRQIDEVERLFEVGGSLI